MSDILSKEVRKVVVNEIIKSGSDIVITIPKKIKWSDYEKELEKVRDGSQVINFKVRHFPKVNVGNKCYLVHDGYVRGWMEIVGLKEQEFTCTTTGKLWKGKFIQRSGSFNKIDKVPMKGFQGFRYYV